MPPSPTSAVCFNVSRMFHKAGGAAGLKPRRFPARPVAMDGVIVACGADFVVAGEPLGVGHSVVESDLIDEQARLLLVLGKRLDRQVVGGEVAPGADEL